MEIEVQRQGSHIAVTIDGNIDTEGGQQLAESLPDLSKMEDVELPEKVDIIISAQGLGVN